MSTTDIELLRRNIDKPLKIGNLYVIIPKITIKSGSVVFDKKYEYPENFKILGIIRYYSLALCDEINVDFNIKKRNYDLTINEPFVITGIEKYDIYNVIQTTDKEVKMGYIKFVTTNQNLSEHIYSAFLLGESNEI